MNHKQRREVETAACERRYGIADAKGSEYSGAGSTYKETGADTLANFKLVGARLGISPALVLLTYWLKHVDSITTTVREAETVDPTDPLDLDYRRNKRYAAGEGIVGRLDDARNYLDLLECLLIDMGAIDRPTKDYIKTDDSALIAAGLFDQGEGVWRVKGFDGVSRPPADKDASVKNPGERQTPIYAQPAVFSPTMDKVRTDSETGEL